VSFQAPVEPVPARRYPVALALVGAFLVLAGAVGLGLWSGAASGPGREAGSALPPMSSVRASAIASVPGSATPTATSALYGDAPPADRFTPTWSIVGVGELAGGGYSIAQVPLEPRATARRGLLAFATCDLGPAPDVAFLPAGTLRLLGAVALHAGHGWIRLSLIDGSIARAFAVIVSYPPSTKDLAVGLFGVSALSPWPRGGYSFYAVDDKGTGRYLYACLGG